jgi:hypothetical protein
MALLIAAGILFYALSGHALAAISSPFHFANRVPSCKLSVFFATEKCVEHKRL